MHDLKYDPSMEKLKPGKHVGIVGESHIWDGPLDQSGRAHGMGSSSGITVNDALYVLIFFIFYDSS